MRIAVLAARVLPAILALSLAAAAAGEGQPAPAPAAGANLVRNGDFSAGQGSPECWSKMDNLSTFWVDGGADAEKAAAEGRKAAGICLKVDTDVYLKEWEEQRKSMEAGKAGDPRAKTPTKG
ncbi:MAG TPA: hypothetical protein PK280_02190, partial [Planctomycetota bacterium]|nr:hypothetical protein [Planctomycetota bacterium]